MMPALALHLGAAGNLATSAQLIERGHSRAEIANAVRTTELWRPRRGWVATPDANPDAVRAIQLGGRLAGSSALATYGIWIDEDGGQIVACPSTASRLPPVAAGEHRLWADDVFPVIADKRWRVSVPDALLQLSRTAPRDSLIASVDSAIQLRQLTRGELRSLVRALPRRLRGIARELDGLAMSGTETRMRLALRRAGYEVRSQVRLPGIGIVDLLVDGWLIIELDSRRYHGGADNQLRDRTRDGNAVMEGYGHERFVWQQVRERMDWCLAVVERRLRDGSPSAASTGGRAREAPDFSC
ncbi:endonuclease domain-containing protein [Parafrigoribacterium soli]|uniref:endonuclease domain-containing protein n=1 Tax=Parafrigoribacterium soli TaxID=3144663 RepID=UPI0032EEA9F6